MQMYETTSGQLMNKEKSQLLIPEKTPPDIIERTKAITGFSHTFGPITYLGCPLYISHQKIIYFTSWWLKLLAESKDGKPKC